TGLGAGATDSEFGAPATDSSAGRGPLSRKGTRGVNRPAPPLSNVRLAASRRTPRAPDVAWPRTPSPTTRPMRPMPTARHRTDLDWRPGPDDQDRRTARDQMGVIIIREMVGTSPTSWSDAARRAVATASKTVRN